ncbi:hypothetical protein D3C87_1026130 [compost metagenome]
MTGGVGRVEGIAADEGEGVDSDGQRVGVQAGEIQMIALGALETVDHIAQSPDAHVRQRTEREGIRASATDEVVGACTANQPVIARTAHQRIVARTTVQNVRGAVARQTVGVGASRQVFKEFQGVEPGAGGVLLGRGREVYGNAGQGALEGHRVSAIAPVQHVVAGSGEQRVVQRVARAIGGASAVDIQMLDVVAEGIGRQAAVHTVNPSRRRIAVDLDHGVIGVVDIVGVVAIAAAHAVGPCGTLEHVIGGIAGDEVVPLIAGAVDVRHAGEHQVLEIGAQGPADRGLHRIDLRGRGVGFHHAVERVIDHIDVVAIATGHGVGSQVAIQCVVTRTAHQGIRLVGTGNHVPGVVENVLHAVVVVGVALEAKVTGNVVGQTLADDLRRLLVQVPDVVGIRQRIDFVAQGEVGVVHRQLDIGALGGDGFLGGADIANPLDDGGNLLL